MFEIPSSWIWTVLRNAAFPDDESFIDGDWIEAPYITDRGIRLIQTGNIGRGRFIEKLDSRKYISEASFRLLNCKDVLPGDLLICRLADPIARTCEVPSHVGKAITAVDCTILRVDPSKFDKRFVLQWLNSDVNLKAAADRAAGSTRSRISRSSLGGLPIPRPAPTEQSMIGQIVDLLDHSLRETEAIIAKLKSVKQGLLHDLLTRGIDTNGELRLPQSEAPHLYKQSRLGWIPKEWNAAPFAEVGSVILGRQSAPRYQRGVNSRPYLRVVNISEDRLDLGDVKRMDFDPSDFERYRLQPGDILLTEGDLVSAHSVGRSAVYNGEIHGCCFQNTLLRFRPIQPAHANYFHFAFCHLRATGRFAAVTTATTVHHLSAGRLEREVFLPLAPSVERLEIAERLQSVEARIDVETTAVTKCLSLKHGIMDDLLTGRVRVTPLLERSAQQTTQAPD